MLKKFAFLILFILLSEATSLPRLSLASTDPYEERGKPSADRIIAIVNKDSITQSEADAYLNIIVFQLSQQYKGNKLEEKLEDEKKQLISRMIEDKIILQEARRQNLQARPDKVKNRIEQLRQGFASETDFEDSLKQKGLTVRDLEAKLNDQMIMREIIEREVRGRILVSPDEVTKFYGKHQDDFLRPEMRAVESLYFEDENILGKLEEGSKNGASLQSLSAEYKTAYAKDTLSKAQLRPEIQEGLFSLGINEISAPLKAGKGWYIFKLLEIHAPKLQSLNEVHDQLYNYIFEQKFTLKMLEWLEELKSKAYVVIK